MLGARHDRRHVGPVLEQLAVAEGIGEQRAGVRSETGEQGQLLAAYEHVHGVDLDHADAVEHAAQVTAVDTAGRAAVGETLGGQRHAAGLGDGELDGRRGHGDQSRSRRRSQNCSTASRKRPVSSSVTSIVRARYPRGAR